MDRNTKNLVHSKDATDSELVPTNLIPDSIVKGSKTLYHLKSFNSLTLYEPNYVILKQYV